MLGIDELYKELKSSNFLVDTDSRKIRKGSGGLRRKQEATDAGRVVRSSGVGTGKS